ncbi:terpene cyclase/mutase family protein [Streptomyces sp. GC420]|uniref:terpene cyclase/mutase family protein n=1 Tax=Streptomyces sp. GC420 TaxID=2697568 RepID=UPI0014151489|nr:terpene cyclase/mutase family protein [Streptomyces sp. GC420]NBM20223.1 hypothetical protein [Streptomyces sp. GC420]
MTVRRRGTAALAITAALLLGAVSPAAAAGSDGLYGTNDPTYDGVWRQSLALLAQDSVGVRPAAQAVHWLAGQQCESGAFAPYRKDTSEACDAKTMVDSNSTAAAVQALAALGGHGAEMEKAVGWLKSVQNKDGGWGYSPGGASDTNSTSVVIGALAAAGQKPDGVESKGGRTPYDALVSLSLPCDVKGGGAFAFQPDKSGKLAANADATAAGVLGGLGKGLAATAGKGAGGSDCADADGSARKAAANGAVHLVDALGEMGHLMSSMPGSEDQPDYGNTADAVVALAAAGRSDAAKTSLAWLEKNSADWAKESGPAAYAQLIFAARAAGGDPRDFGGADLVRQLNATGPAPEATKTASPDSGKDEDKKSEDGEGLGVWWIVGIGLVAGIGIGFLVSARRKSDRL